MLELQGVLPSLPDILSPGRLPLDRSARFPRRFHPDASQGKGQRLILKFDENLVLAGTVARPTPILKRGVS
jgi:hypothetical protein